MGHCLLSFADSLDRIRIGLLACVAYDSVLITTYYAMLSLAIWYSRLEVPPIISEGLGMRACALVDADEG